MSNTQQAENVDHAVIAYTQPERLDPFEAMMRMGVESHTQTINGGIDSGLNGSG